MRTFKVKIVNVKVKRAWRPTVTNHALFRYCERVLGIDFDRIRKTMQSEPVRNAMLLGAKRIRLADCTLVFEDGRIVTCVGKDMKNHHHARPRLEVVG